MAQYFSNDDNLKSEFRTIVFKHGDELTNFTSDLGVFSKDKIDYGSNLLIDTYFQFGRKNVTLLDVGCGYGVIGIILSKYMGTSSTLIDINSFDSLSKLQKGYPITQKEYENSKKTVLKKYLSNTSYIF